MLNSIGDTEPLQEVSIHTESSIRTDSRSQIAFGVVCLVLSFLAYKCVVSKSFLGDDHVHLIWLRQAVLDPSLVLRNFYSNWLYPGTTPQCYRPMISVCMFTDYLLWHHNAIGFHITNFLFHLLSCVALYGCVYEVSRWSARRSLLTLWPVLAGGTFALYPSHPEAVSWVTGRVDALVTAFYLASVYSFMLWRRTHRGLVLAASLLFMLLSLASKEMAVTIPVIWFLFEFFRPKHNLSDGVGSVSSASLDSDGGAASSNVVSFFGKPSALVEQLKNAIAASLPAWTILAAYFGLRRLALGTFIGGYDDSLAIDKALLFRQWTDGLHMFFVPLNAFYATDNAWLAPVWITLTGAVYLVSISALFKNEFRKQLVFFAAFAVVSLAPVYKLFNGLPDLEGSRFSYLASAPIAAFFAFGLAYLPLLIVRPQKVGQVYDSQISTSVRWYQAVICIAYFCTAAFMLWLNNQPWSVAGRWVSTLEKSFDIILAGQPARVKFAFFNIPNNYRGAYLARNAIGDIGRHQEVDWKAIEPDDKHSETGQIRQSILDGGNNYQSYYWNDVLEKFVPIRLSPELKEGDVSNWNALSLTDKCSIIQGRERIEDLSSDGKWTISPGTTPIMLVLNYSKLQPSSVEFLQVDATRNKSSSSLGDEISLLVSSAFLPTLPIKASFQLSSVPKFASFESKTRDERILFTLRLIPGWFGTNEKSSAVLVIPASWSGSFDLTIKKSDCILPRLRRLSKVGDVSARSQQTLFYDVSKIQTATSAVLQISKKNECFASQCTFDFDDEHSGKLIPLSGCSSSIKLKYADLNGDGQYQVRCWALDGVGNRVGVSSDYLFITAQKNAFSNTANIKTQDEEKAGHQH